uniref:Putative secreted protein n=1 Tax=Anopheles darlingi TaxID=43151 RepID=A0A2M4DHG7_ANODA
MNFYSIWPCLSAGALCILCDPRQFCATRNGNDSLACAMFCYSFWVHYLVCFIKLGSFLPSRQTSFGNFR